MEESKERGIRIAIDVRPPARAFTASADGY